MDNFHVAVPTSFNTDETLNCELTIQHAMNLYNKGVRTVLICGSTGEQHSLTINEKIALLNYIKSYPIPSDFNIIFGVSGITKNTVKMLTKNVAKNRNITTVLVGFPSYIIPSQSDAIAYCKTISDEADDKPLIIYNNPKRTGFNVQFDTYLKLFEYENVIGIKEAGQMEHIQKLIKCVERNILVFYGGDYDIELAVNNGYNALSSIAGNIYPNEVYNLFTQLLADRIPEKDIHDKIKQLYSKPLLPHLKQLISEKENLPFGKCRWPLGADSSS